MVGLQLGGLAEQLATLAVGIVLMTGEICRDMSRLWPSNRGSILAFRRIIGGLGLKEARDACLQQGILATLEVAVGQTG